MLEPMIQKKLRKLFDAWIIFKVQHSTWVSNLFPVRKKSDEIHLCVNFHLGLNKETYALNK